MAFHSWLACTALLHRRWTSTCRPQTRGGEVRTKWNVMKYFKKDELDTLIVAVGWLQKRLDCQYKRSENGFLISKSGSGSNSWIPAVKDPAGFAVTDTDTELQSYPALFFWGRVVYYWTCQHYNHLWRLSGLLLFFFKHSLSFCIPSLSNAAVYGNPLWKNIPTFVAIVTSWPFHFSRS